MTERKSTNETSEEVSKNSPLIVGIGASAGGLEALQQFFQHMPGNSGLSFVVIQHLSPDYKSLMADILGKHTEMQVMQAENEMEILPDNCLPHTSEKEYDDPGTEGSILTDFVQGTLNHPIDVFFTSLAKEQNDRSIAVVLSGTGSDGTSGVKAVKEKGGLVIVQSPETAKFDGMPRSAINTGLADFILSPDEIVDEILNFSHYPTLLRPQEKDVLFSDEETFPRIYAILKKASGIDFTNYKRTTVLRRIERRMVVTHKPSLAEYVEFLSGDADEASILVKEILHRCDQFLPGSVVF